MVLLVYMYYPAGHYTHCIFWHHTIVSLLYPNLYSMDHLQYHDPQCGGWV